MIIFEIQKLDVQFPQNFKDSLLESIGIGIISTDFAGNVLTINKEAEEMWDCSRSFMVGQPFVLLLAQHERKRMLRTFNYVVNTEKGLRATGVVFENRAGKTLYINAYASVFRDESGNKLGIVMWTENLTEERKLEKEAKMASRLNEIVIDSIGTGIIAVDLEGNILKINGAAKKMYALEKEAPEGQSFLRGLAEHEWPRFKKTHDYVVKTGKVFQGSEIKLTNRIGKTIYINAYSSLILSPTGRKLGLAMLTEDITERKKLESDIQQADRLAALGQMAMGLSHEIRTPLGTIKALCTLIKEDLSYFENVEKSINYLNFIIKEVDRLGNLSRELLDYSGNFGSKEQKSPININIILGKVILLGKMSNCAKKTKIITDFQEDLPNIIGDRELLTHAFMNLFINAVEATKHADTIRIKTSFDDKWIYVIVADTGEGIEESALDKIFDPFYTTKDYGTGLGLSIVHTIITNHDGTINVESDCKAGTTFTVKLPIKSKGEILNNGLFSYSRS